MEDNVSVEVKEIESELYRQWKRQGAINQVKGSLFNLIIYTREPRKIDYLRSLVRAFTQKFPCRMIFILSDSHFDPDHLHVTVANDMIDSTAGAISRDRIIIEASTKQLQRVPFIVFPNLVPDLPIYLFWGQNPTKEDEVLSQLQKFATRLIFDSECTWDLQEYSQNMLKQMKQITGDLMDINWALISGWRLMLSRIFDSQDRLEQLYRTKKITIHYNCRKTDYIERIETQAVYLQAWLAAQLSWRFLSKDAENGILILKYTNGDHDIEVILCEEFNQELPPGKLLSIEFVGDVGDIIHITHKEKVPKATVHISTKDKCEMPFKHPLGDYQRTFAFTKEIFYHDPSAHYVRMLRTLAQVPWEGE